MLYESSITIPANTASTSPTVVTMGIARGVITEFMVYPHPGHAGLAHLTIHYQGHQIAPSTEGMDLHGDTFPIDWEDYIEVDQPPFDLKLEGWNEDDTYEHSFDVFIAVIEKRWTLGQLIASAIRDVLSIFSPRRIFTGGG